MSAQAEAPASGGGQQQQSRGAPLHAPAPSLAMSAQQVAQLQQQGQQQQQQGDISERLRQLKIEEQQKAQQQQTVASSSSSSSSQAAAAGGPPVAVAPAASSAPKKKEMGAVRYAAERVIGNGSFGVVYQSVALRQHFHAPQATQLNSIPFQLLSARAGIGGELTDCASDEAPPLCQPRQRTTKRCWSRCERNQILTLGIGGQ
jgi:hypothetical protein